MLKISLGPLQYYWERETVFNFYDAMAAAPVDVVYLGEAVCSRRHELRLSDWLDIARRLRSAGKEVVLSTQVLLESGAEVGTMHKITGNGDFLVEANDMGAVQCLSGKVPFVAGPHLNIYNLPTLQWMAGLGATRWVIPLEMKRSDLAVIQQGLPAGMQTEVFAYGRKDDCRFSCLDHPDGLMLKTREHEEFLVLNGTQTQSARVYNLVDSLDDMQSLGVHMARLSPQSQHMADVVAVFDAARTHKLTPQDALARLQPLMPDRGCNGYWHGQPGLDQVASAALAEPA
jgi:collagenase-like PrtC family protease